MIITKPKRGIRLNILHPLVKGLVGCWLFNEGSGQKYYDLSLYKNHGTQSDKLKAPKWTSGKYGRGLKFDGTSSYVNCGNDVSLLITDAISIEKWIKIPSTGTWRATLSKGGTFTTPSQYDWCCGVSDTEKVVFMLSNGTSHIICMTTTNSISVDVWHHYVATWDGNNAYVYVDGEKWGEDTGTGVISASHNLRLGGIANEMFNGTMDNVRIYNRALSASEIKYSYRHPFAIFEFEEVPSNMFRYTTLKTTKELELWKDRIE